MADEDGVEEEQECPAGAPEWMATFADLSTLLMSFFVLLLAFSEMDAARFNEVSGSLKR
ncbi:MAG: flagellar motor protein MotB, partial [Pseudomonadota bacterium]